MNIVTRNKGIFPLSTLTVSCLMAFNSYAAVDCSAMPNWDAATAYGGGAQVQHNNTAYQANYWTQNNDPSTHSGDYAQWQVVDTCSGGVVVNDPPSVSLTSPVANSEFNVGDTVTFTANAADTDGSVAKVDFLVAGVVVGSATSAPYSFSWSATEGAHTVSAKSVDDQGAESTLSSANITVTQTGPVNVPPTVDVALSVASVDVDANGNGCRQRRHG